MLKLAIVGTGGISQAHIAAWSHIPEVSLVAACDIRPEKVDAVAKTTGAKAYYAFEDMLQNESIDILDICVPTYLHADFAVLAIQKGIHVLTEKPISLRQEDVHRVYQKAKEHGVRFMVAQVLRFWPEYVRLKEAYDGAVYGKLLSGSMTRLGNTPKWSWNDWMTDPARSGLVPFDLHIHDLDFMVYAFGKPKDMRCSRARNARQDDLHAIYEYEDFFVATEAAWYDCTFIFRSSYRFQFELAVMEYADNKLTIYHQDGRIESIGAQDGDANGINLPTTNAYYNEIRYFTDCVLAGKDCDTVQATELETVLTCIAQLDT